MKRLLCFIIFSSLLLLSGCSGGEDFRQASVMPVLDYQIMMTSESENLDNGVKSFKYPSLDGSVKGVDYSAVNKLIADTVHAVYDEYAECENADEFSFDVDTAEVMCATNRLFSAFFSGSLYMSGAAHDAIFAFTVNIDLESGTAIKTQDVVTDFAALKTSFEGGAFTQSFGVEGLTEQAEYADMFVEYREEYGIYPDIYFTPDGIGVVVELVYALGGFASFELPYASAATFLNRDNAALASVVDLSRLEEQLNDIIEP